MLTANLATTFTNSSSTGDIPNSSVENQDQNVFILFELTQRKMRMKSYSAAMQKINAFVKQWGAKEMDFEVGSGPQNSTAGGVFQVRLSRNPLPGDTGNTTTGWKAPDFFSMVIPPQRLSSAIKANRSALPTLSALTTSTNSLPKTALNAVGLSATKNTTLTTKSAVAAFNASRISATINFTLTHVRTKSAAAALNAVRISATKNATLTAKPTVAALNASGILTNKNVTLTTHSAVAASYVVSISATTNATLTARSTAASNVVGTPATTNATLTTGSAAAALNAIGTSAKTNATLTARSTAVVLNVVGTPGTTNATLTTGSAAAASIAVGVSMTTNSTLTTHSAAAGGAVPHRDGHGDAAALAGGAGAAVGAGVAAGAVGADLGLGSGSGAALPGAAEAAAAGANSVDTQQNDNSQNNDSEDGNEDEDNNLSLGSLSPSQSQAPASQTGNQLASQSQAQASQTLSNQLTSQSQAQASQTLSNQLTSQSQAPGSQNLTQVASTTATLPASRTLAPTGFLTTVAPSYNSSIPVSNMTITSCSACINCPGFQVNVAAPPSNSTSDDLNDDGDDDDEMDDDSNDGDGNPKKRALARRFNHQKRETPLLRNWVGSVKTKCYVTTFTRKPAYPGPNLIAKYDGAPNVPASMTPFYKTAKYWAVPSDVPKGSCEVPSWQMRNTPNLLLKDPAINPNAWILGGSGAYGVNVDHVYEVQLLNMFFYTRMLLNPGDQYFISCDDIAKVFDVVDDPSQPELGTRLNQTFSKLASYENPELVGMSELLNLKKAIIFSFWFKVDLKKNDSPMVLGKGYDPLSTTQQLAQFALTLNILQNDTIWPLFEQTNTRIYQQFQRIDQLIQYKADNNCADKFLDAAGQPLPATWADSYSDFMTDKIITANNRLQLAATKGVNAVPTDDSPRFKVPPRNLGEPAAVWAPWLSSFTDEFPVAQMTLPPVANWPAASPAKFGPGDCAVPQTMSNSSPIDTLVPTSQAVTLAPVTTAPAVTPFISSPLSVAATSAIGPATTATANGLNGDPCGPQHQDTPNYPNTCNAKVDLVQSPSAYGVNCTSGNHSDVHPSEFKAGQIEMNWQNCMSSVQQICGGIDKSTNPTGYWVWSYQTEGCAVGVYLPSYSGSAAPPSPERCQTLIFEAIVDSCSTTTIPSNMGSVNVVTNPSYSLADTFQGAQVNAGYPSYIVSPTMPGWMGNPPPPWPVPDYGGNPWAEDPPKPFTIKINVGERDVGRGSRMEHRGENRFR